MNILEHYIIEVKKITEYNDDYIIVEVLCNCWGNKSIVEHFTSKAAWGKRIKTRLFHGIGG